MRMRITYSSCKLLILFVRKLTKAYKNSYKLLADKFRTGISILKGKGPVISLIRIFH